MSPPARKVAFNAAVSAASNVVGKLSTLAWTAVVARQLLRQEFGAFNVALSLGLILAAIGEWGFDTALVQRVSRDHSRLSDELTACLVWEVGVGLLLFGVGGGIGVWRTHGETQQVALALVLAATFADTISDSARAGAAAVQRQGGTSAALGLQRVLTAALVIPVVLRYDGLLPLAAAYLTGAVIGVVAHLRAVHRLGARIQLRRLDREKLRAFVRHTSALGISGLVLAALFRVDALLVDAFKGEAAVASYAAAYRVFDTALFVVFAINGAVFPVLSARAHDADAFDRTFRNAVAAFAAVYLPMGAVCLVDAHGVLRLLFGAQYATTSAPALRWLAFAPLVFAVAFLASSAVVATTRTRGLLVAAAAATAVNIGVDIVAIPRMGGTGAAMMTTIAYVVQGGVLMVVLRRSGFSTPIVRPMLEPAAGAIVVAIALALLHLPFLAEVAIALCAYAVVWLGLLSSRGGNPIALLKGTLVNREA